MLLQKNLVVILCGLFLVMVGFGITLPVLPFYIKNLSQGIGMSLLMLPSEIGLILVFVSIVSAGMAILTPSLASLVTIESDETYGTSLGIYSSVNSLGQMLGIIVGSVMMIWFVHLPYFIISIILFIAAWFAIPRSKFKILQPENIKQ